MGKNNLPDDLIIGQIRGDINAAFKKSEKLRSDTLRTGFEFYSNGNTLGRLRNEKDEVDKWQRISNSYIDEYWKGLVYLPSESLLFYLPRLILYFLEKVQNGHNIDDLLDQFFFCIINQTPKTNEPTDVQRFSHAQLRAIELFLDGLSAFTSDESLILKRDKARKKLIDP